MNLKKLNLSVVINLISVVINLLVSLLITRHIVETAGKELYSFYPIVVNIINVVAILTISINSFSARYITLAKVNNDEKNMNKYYSTTFYGNLLFTGIMTIIMFIIVVYLELFLNIPSIYLIEVKLLFIFIFLSVIFNQIFAVYSTFVYVINRIDIKAYIEIIVNVIKILIYILLYLNNSLDIVMFGIVTALMSLINGIVYYIFSKKMTPYLKVQWSDYSKEHLIEIISSGKWVSLSTLGMLLINSMTMYLTNILVGVEESANLGVVQVFSSVILAILASISSINISSILHNHTNKNKFNNILNNQQFIVNTILIAPVIIMMFLGDNFIYLWVKSSYVDEMKILIILLLIPYLFRVVVLTMSNMNIVYDKNKFPSIMILFVGIANLILSVFLVEVFKLGVYGILYSSIITQFIYMILIILPYSIYYSKNKNLIMVVVKSIIFFILSITILNTIDYNKGMLGWLNFILLCGLYFVLLLILSTIIELIFKNLKKIKFRGNK